MTITQLLTTEPGLTLAVSLLGGAWTFLKSRDWFRRNRENRRGQALRAVEAGVEETYRTYVRELKKGHADGKLTETEIRRARLRAKERAVVFARREGLDLVKELGADFVDFWITKSVRKLKRGEA